MDKCSYQCIVGQFIAVVSGCLFNFSQNIFSEIQSLGLTTQYMEDSELAIYMRMLRSLAFVPENEACDCFTLIWVNFRKLQQK